MILYTQNNMLEEQEKEIQELEIIISYLEAIKNIAPDKRNEEKKKLLEQLKESHFLEADFNEEDDNLTLKSQFIKACLIYDDISMYDGVFLAVKNNLKSICRVYQATKNVFLPLALLRSYINGWGRFHKDNVALNELRSKIMPGLEFANHVRNKITGHIDDNVLNKSVQWEPSIFEDKQRDRQIEQRICIYKAILESAINSYIDPNTGEQKVFKQEIDIIFPDTSKLFYMYIQELIKDSLEYLDLFMALLNSRIVYYPGIPANILMKASETDFDIKK